LSSCSSININARISTNGLSSISEERLFVYVFVGAVSEIGI
jgi:hypothetical protein